MNLKEIALTVLGSATVDLQNGDSKSIAYTVPVGKEAYVFGVLIANPTASLAGGTDFDIGSGANADTWKQTNNLSSLTSTDDYLFITQAAKYTVEAAGAQFGIKPITGATADAQATMYVIGIEVDA